MSYDYSGKIKIISAGNYMERFKCSIEITSYSELDLDKTKEAIEAAANGQSVGISMFEIQTFDLSTINDLNMNAGDFENFADRLCNELITRMPDNAFYTFIDFLDQEKHIAWHKGETYHDGMHRGYRLTGKEGFGIYASCHSCGKIFEDVLTIREVDPEAEIPCMEAVQCEFCREWVRPIDDFGWVLEEWDDIPV